MYVCMYNLGWWVIFVVVEIYQTCCVLISVFFWVIFWVIAKWSFVLVWLSLHVTCYFCQLLVFLSLNLGHYAFLLLNGLSVLLVCSLPSTTVPLLFLWGITCYSNVIYLLLECTFWEIVPQLYLQVLVFFILRIFYAYKKVCFCIYWFI